MAIIYQMKLRMCTKSIHKDTPGAPECRIRGFCKPCLYLKKNRVRSYCAPYTPQ